MPPHFTRPLRRPFATSALLLGILLPLGIQAAPRRLGGGGMRLPGRANSVAFHPDGETLAATGEGGKVLLFDPLRRVRRGELPGLPEWGTKLLYSATGDALAGGGSDGSVKVWDLEGDRVHYSDRSHSGQVFALAFSTDGRTLYSGDFKGEIRVHDLAGDQPSRALDTSAADRVQGSDRGVVSLLVSADGATLVASMNTGWAGTWDAATETQVAMIRTERAALALAPTGDQVLFAKTGAFELRGLPALDLQSSVVARNDFIHAAAFSPQGDELLLQTGRGTLEAWTIPAWQWSHTLGDETIWDSPPAYSSDGRWVASPRGMNAVLYDRKTRAPRSDSAGHHGPILSISSTPDGRVVTTASDGSAIDWDLASGQVQHQRPGLLNFFPGKEPVRNNALAMPSGRDLYLVPGSPGLDRNGADLALRPALDPGLSCIARGHSPGLVVVGTYEGSVHLIRPETGRSRRLSEVHDSQVLAAATAPGSQVLVTGAESGQVFFWDLRTGRVLSRQSEHLGPVVSVAVSADGAWAASGGRDRTLIFWDPRTGQERFRSGSESLDLTGAVSFSADSRLLAAGGTDGTVRLIELAKKREVHRLQAGEGAVFPVYFAPSSGRLMAGSERGVIYVWEPEEASGSRLESPLAPPR